MKFREHNGSLDESMATVVDVDGIDGLIRHCAALMAPWGVVVTPSTLAVEPYGYDTRIGWQTHIVTLKGYGVLGFTDRLG